MEMHDVVEMLLNRMKDYPENFVGEPSDYRDMADNKWKKALRIISGVVAPHEKEALDIRLEEARRVVYMGIALKTIMSDEAEEEQQVFQGKYTITQTGSTQTGSTITKSYFDEYDERIKALEAAKAAQLQKQIFGKV